MISFLQAHLATIIISLALAAVVALIVINLVRRRRRGESSCSCDCSGCPGAQTCHPPQRAGRDRHNNANLNPANHK